MLLRIGQNIKNLKIQGATNIAFKALDALRWTDKKREITNASERNTIQH